MKFVALCVLLSTASAAKVVGKDFEKGYRCQDSLDIENDPTLAETIVGTPIPAADNGLITSYRLDFFRKRCLDAFEEEGGDNKCVEYKYNKILWNGAGQCVAYPNAAFAAGSVPFGWKYHGAGLNA